MAANVIENATVELMDFTQFAEFAADNLNYSGETDLLNHVTAELRANPYNSTYSSLTTHEQWAEQIATKLESAGYEVAYDGNGKWTCSAFPKTANLPATNPVNSNITTVNRGTVRTYYGGINEFDGTLQRFTPTRFPVSGGLASQAKYFYTSVSSAIAAVSGGIWLGKTIDSLLYNANPDFWDANGMSTLNPETWNTITNGDDSIFANLFNMILGLDPDTGNAQMYMDADALAYIAYYLKDKGAFNAPQYAVNSDTPTIPSWSKPSSSITLPLFISAGGGYVQPKSDTIYKGVVTSSSSTVYAVNIRSGWMRSGFPILVSDAPFTAVCRSTYPNGNVREQWNYPIYTYTVNGHTYYYAQYNVTLSNNGIDRDPEFTDTGGFGGLAPELVYYIYNVGVTDVGGVQGISNQPDATLPDTSNWNDIPSTLASLQQQYPEAFANPMIWNNDSPYDDTTGSTKTYIPVPFPDVDTNGDPISGPQTQTSTLLSPTTTPQTTLDLIAKLLQQPTTATGTPSEIVTPPTNPNDTGTGETPVPAIPEGYASALWSVYHPTQAQVDAFGGWLWTGNIITQIQQLLQNPMDGIITLHKIFAPPVDAGEGTIVIGRLDSEVPSATVNQQYVEVNCGSVSCSEQFGNVFDYVGTKVSLYLPFIGIVPLNVSEVMRSTINVKYGVDVFTGACLAMVNVSRDGNTVNMYQYSGVASVEYPITAGLHMGILNGIIGVASGVAMIASSTTPMGGIMGAVNLANGAIAADTVNQSHSGGFSGNVGAMGIKKPYLIIERPQTKIASTFPYIDGYPTNYSVTLGSCSNHVKCSSVHVSGINATEKELLMIESLLKEGVEV